MLKNNMHLKKCNICIFLAYLKEKNCGNFSVGIKTLNRKFF